MTNPAGAAIVNAIGPIRQLVRGEDKIPRRYLVALHSDFDRLRPAIRLAQAGVSDQRVPRCCEEFLAAV